MGTTTCAQHLRYVGVQFDQVLAASGPFGIYGSLGATDRTIVGGEHRLGGLRFTARILPFNKDGERSYRPTKMNVEISLNPRDLIDVKVTRQKDGVVHYEGTDFFIDQLPGVIYALDYDGDTPLNPRIL